MVEKHPCDGCYYFGGRWETVKCCNYYLLTDHRRPCPAGKGCTVRRDGECSRRKAASVSRKK